MIFDHIKICPSSHCFASQIDLSSNFFAFYSPSESDFKIEPFFVFIKLIDEQ